MDIARKIGWVVLTVLSTTFIYLMLTVYQRTQNTLIQHQRAVWAFQSDIPTCLIEGICYLHITQDGVVEMSYASTGSIRTPTTAKLDPSLLKRLPPLGRVIYRKEDGNLQIGDLSNMMVADSIPYSPE